MADKIDKFSGQLPGSESIQKKKIRPRKIDPDQKTAIETVYDVIRNSPSGISIDSLSRKTGFTGRKLSNSLYKLSVKGVVETVSRGVYAAKKP